MHDRHSKNLFGTEKKRQDLARQWGLSGPGTSSTSRSGRGDECCLIRFSSLFFPIVVCLFWCTPQRLRWVLLLVASYYFYMCWRPPYAILLVVITALDFCVGRALGVVTGAAKRRAILLISVAANLSILFVFKYYPFVANTLNGWQRFNVFPELAIVLPIGLSFHTFQSMGYMFDVYRRN